MRANLGVDVTRVSACEGRQKRKSCGHTFQHLSAGTIWYTPNRRNKDSSCVRYVQLAQNERDEHGVTRANVLYSFGREDQLDKAALRRLVQSICRCLDPAEAAQVQLQLEGVGPSLIDSRSLGGAWLLDQLWRMIGIDRVLGKLLAQRRYRAELERLLFAMVANCALAASSKLSITDWVAEEVAIPDLASVPLPEPDEADDRRKVRLDFYSPSRSWWLKPAWLQGRLLRSG